MHFSIISSAFALELISISQAASLLPPCKRLRQRKVVNISGNYLELQSRKQANVPSGQVDAMQAKASAASYRI